MLPSEDGRKLGKFVGSTDGESETIFDVESFEGAELGTWDSGGLGTLEGCGDGEADSVLVVGSLEGVELGSQLTEEEGETLGTCDCRVVGSIEGVDDGSLLGVAHPMKTGSWGRPKFRRRRIRHDTRCGINRQQRTGIVTHRGGG